MKITTYIAALFFAVFSMTGCVEKDNQPSEGQSYVIPDKPAGAAAEQEDNSLPGPAVKMVKFEQLLDDYTAKLLERSISLCEAREFADKQPCYSSELKDFAMRASKNHTLLLGYDGKTFNKSYPAEWVADYAEWKKKNECDYKHYNTNPKKEIQCWGRLVAFVELQSERMDNNNWAPHTVDIEMLDVDEYEGD